MKFGLKTLLAFITVVAIAIIFVRPELWRRNARRDVDSGIRPGIRSEGDPVIHAIGFFEVGARVIVLHRVTTPEHDDGDVVRPGSHVPDWLEARSFGPGQIFDCVIDGRRISIDDDVVQVFYATDGERPTYVRLNNRDYASLDSVGFLETIEKMWNLAVQHSMRAGQ